MKTPTPRYEIRYVLRDEKHGRFRDEVEQFTDQASFHRAVLRLRQEPDVSEIETYRLERVRLGL